MTGLDLTTGDPASGTALSSPSGLLDARIVVALAATYALYAVLLNSVGTVILQAIVSFGASKTEGSILEGCKDLTIAGVSFAFAATLPRIGYRRALIAGFLLLAAACSAMPLLRSFWATALCFGVTGATFGLAKVAVYGAVGLVSPGPQRHASLTSLIEGIFMAGVLAGYWLFSAFIDPRSPLAWLRVYWVLAAACLALAALWAVSPLDERALAEGGGGRPRAAFVAMLGLLRRPLVIVFLFCAFLYVLIEQSLGTWMPTFDHEVLRLSPRLSVQLTSLYAVSLCVGRLGASGLLRRVSRFGALLVCVAAMAPLVVLALAATAGAGAAGTVDSWRALPPAALILPLIGVLMSPIYPTVNSVVLSALPVERQAGMTGLIVVFSALGGTVGSFLTGRLFAVFGGRTAIAGVLVPILLLLVGLAVMRRLTPSQGAATQSAPERL